MSVENGENLKKIQIQVLDEVHRVCAENKIEYSLDSGTLLGAVRHKGFIPWDDDVDLIMNRENYQKFISIASTKLGKEYSLVHYTTQKKYPLTFAKVVRNDTKLIEDNFKNLNFNNGVFVDIFVADRVPLNPRILKKYLFKLKKSNLIKYSYSLKVACKASRLHIKLLRFFAFFINRIIGFYRLNKNEDALWRRFSCDRKAEMTFGSNITLPHKMSSSKLVEYALFDKYINISFEGREYRCIEDFHKYLNVLYGNYMELPPIEQRQSGHNYILFEDNIDISKS